MTKFDKAKQILLAGFCINLCMGILYAWSVFKQALVLDMGWSDADASMPYSVAVITFALSLLVAGVLQDRMGPRKILILGTVLVGSGMIISSFATTPLLLLITFGLMTGAGIGFGYACLAPSAMKWFHPSKKGLVNGLIAAGFGLAAVYLAPLTSLLIDSFGISNSFLILGVAILLIAVPLASTITNPPEGYKPQVPANYKAKAGKPVDIQWRAMLKTPQFYSLWVMFALASSAGLMVIGNITLIASQQAHITEAAFLVVVLSIFNSGGRVVAGMLADKIGGLRTLTIAFIMQGINMALFASFDSSFTLMIGAALAGVGYGTLLAVFPTLTAEFYGLKNYGANFGVLYTAWGVSGFIGSAITAIAMGASGNYTLAYSICAVMLAFNVLLSVITKPVDAEALEKKLAKA
ncbi:OFA family MFS transporter [Photobacterium sp. ZSDE20]|uniref:OFA family MFS transporter n=1 Tax=Photobacterium pectinilyticum TaxID=2906793 RepID=A0ABT1N5C3_9GAMM|nr:OFA family MFS transporter [Photobacterium sp. ZSDE20]MCQ1058434.1 OFA family MFS transporter [Photobacterium sp. ZSDE20]MDD1823157.1 OFA family MFS transporter [Photobacterium sp. ZSDE20]